MVALSATHRGTAQALKNGTDHVVTIEVSGDLAVDFGLGDFRMTNEVPRPGGDEASGFDTIDRARPKDITGELFTDESTSSSDAFRSITGRAD